MVDPNVVNIPVTSLQQQRQDGAVLHFLKELPGVVWVVLVLVFFTIMYRTTRDDFIPRIIDGLIGAFLSLVVANRPLRQNVTTGPVTTDTVKTESMDNATVNTDNIELNKKE